MKHEHHHQHQHLTTATLKPPFSLLSMSARQRLAWAGGLLAALWAVVGWALRELA